MQTCREHENFTLFSLVLRILHFIKEECENTLETPQVVVLHKQIALVTL